MKFPNLHIVWAAGKNLALPDTRYLALPDALPDAVKTDIDQSQINNFLLFPLYLECQNNHYEVDLLGTSTFKPIPYSSRIKNNIQQKPIRQQSYRKDLFP